MNSYRDVQFETAPWDDEERWLELPAEFEVDDKQTRTCSRCGGPLSVIRPAPRPHWAELRCKQCSKFHGWLQTPDSELGRFYVMPLGKYRGKTLDEIAAIDRGYLCWIASASDFKTYSKVDLPLPRNETTEFARARFNGMIPSAKKRS